MYEPYFHVGILVRDVEAARADFTAKLGVEFEPVHSQQIATGETTRFCYSLAGSALSRAGGDDRHRQLVTGAARGLPSHRPVRPERARPLHRLRRPGWT